MLRLALACLGLCCFLSPAWASREIRTSTKNERLAPLPLEEVQAKQKAKAVASAPQPDFVLTEESEIRLNGEPCRFKDVPTNAEIVYVEVARDRKTILKIHFRTLK